MKESPIILTNRLKDRKKMEIETQDFYLFFSGLTEVNFNFSTFKIKILFHDLKGAIIPTHSACLFIAW
jgi:hypothetical protein